MKKLFIAATLLLLTSCTHQNQHMRFNISLKEAKSNIGNGTKIDLIVFDERSDDGVIGTKEFSHDEKIKIINEENIAILLTKKINQNLMEKGFAKGTGKTLEIHIEKLHYQAKREFFVGSSEAEAAIKVVVKNGKDKSTFTKNFSLSLSGKHFIAPLESTDAATINNLLQEITQDILNNEELLKTLAK